MSGYGRGRLLLDDSESEGERNSERRRHPNVTPYDRQPVPSVSGERHKVLLPDSVHRDLKYTATTAVYHSIELIVHPQWQITI